MPLSIDPLRRYRHDTARKYSETGGLAEFSTRFEEHLHAKTNSKQRCSAARDFLDHRYEAPASEFFHRIGKGTHARQYDPLGLKDALCIRAKEHLRADMLQPALDAQQIAHAVINDDDFRVAHTVSR